ncbi:gamma-carboxygeranoyl-CoA hydratase [Vibrio sp. JPW-9-11-11]|uniref:enoyl-CoA hydratase-related protein n=1 Tax=Vibrio sp. JPW-9-11-11 TaxID=1416532 RepID=UPI001593574F|nr:enoyl-CoA hydratase-related protein [Vibrio sp. JPW-9-11-11]NVD08059.1 gamma-carboxygeranoyl-CoA hydratase [Vibrio sp. JPW-9-11-11]
MTTHSYQHIRFTLEPNGLAYLTLNRPEQANAFNAQMITELLDAMDFLATQPSARGLMLSGEGKHFCAGADIDWMRSMADKDHSSNLTDAYQLATLMHTLDTLPLPTLALVQGSAFGGALGLICCCDMAIASDDARFCLSEVKLGLVPATIAPYVIRAMGNRQARRYMLSAEMINASSALSLGLVHHIASAPAAKNEAQQWLENVAQHGPEALRMTKALCQHCDHHMINESLIQYTSDLIAQVRVSAQGQEGLNAFLDKRAPNWQST